MPDSLDAERRGSGLPRIAANHVPLSPVGFLEHAAEAYGDRTAVVHGHRRYTYGQFLARARCLASALAALGVGRGDTVAILAPNIPAMLEAHYAVPALGAVLNSLNIRLDAAGLAFCLRHGGARVLLTDTEFAPTVRAALAGLDTAPLVIDIADIEGGERLGQLDYEDLLVTGDPHFAWPGPLDEWDDLSLLYTSGTTGNPKGVVYSHRGAALSAMSNALGFGLRPDSVYLWTLPMFHCDGWTFTWAVTAAGGTHVCLRRIDVADVFRLIVEEGVTHLCGAPVVLTMLIHAPAASKRDFGGRRVHCATGGAAPPSATIEAMEALGFEMLHLYGTTEAYGPAAWCAPQPGWQALPMEARAAKMARQGVAMLNIAAMRVADPETGQPVPRDGQTMGEIQLRGNGVMKGYLGNADANEAAFVDGWYRTGDLAVWHGDNYVEVKDRSKDIIISGGENISSLEVEEALYRHPAVMEAAVVARPDAFWGETPCAFVTLKPGQEDAVTPEEIWQYCRGALAGFKVPRSVVFGPLPKTSTGKILKFTLRARAAELTTPLLGGRQKGADGG